MRALVLVGGKATRLRPLTEYTPKAMAPVLGRPFLEHVLAWLVRYDVRDVTLLLGFLPGPIRTHFGDGHRFGVKLSYVFEHEPLGSGGAIKQLEADLDQPFFALNGDIFTDLNLDAMLADHRSADAAVSIALTPVDDPSAYGVVSLDDYHRIRSFVEKPSAGEAPSNLANAGVWLIDPSAVQRIAPAQFTMVERDLFPVLAAEGQLHGFTGEASYWIDAGTPDRYLQLQRDLLAGQAAGALALVEQPGWPGIIVRGSVGEDAEEDRTPVLGDRTRLTGSVVLGSGVATGDGCLIEGPTTVGARTTLGRGVKLRDSIIWNDSRIDDDAAVISSILAHGCHIGAAARVENCILGERVTVPPGVHLTGRSLDAGTSV